MIEHSRIANPKTHYGKPGSGTRAFVWQRATGALNVAFLAFLIWFVVRLAGTDRGQMVSVAASPIVAIVLALLAVNAGIHMWIGMREVIEDYMDEGNRNRLAMAANTLFAVVVVALMLVSIAKIVFWG